MNRIFTGLAVVAVTLMAANLLVGLAGGDYQAAARKVMAANAQRMAALEARARDAVPDRAALKAAEDAHDAALAEYRPVQRYATMHILLGVAAGLTAVLVNSLTITYFVGTSRWCKEVCDAYSLDQELADRGQRIKRASFPWAVGGIMGIVALIALGAACDPSGANSARSASFVTPHMIAAFVVIVWTAYAFYRQGEKLAENQALVRELMENVREARAKRGLPTETESHRNGSPETVEGTA